MVEMCGFMSGKCGLIMGLVNKKLIVWGIVKLFVDVGVELVFMYQGEVLKKCVEFLGEELGVFVVGYCDVIDIQLIDDVFKVLEDRWGKIDFVVYVVVFFDKNELIGCFVDIMFDNFVCIMDIFCYLFMVVI